MTINRRIKRIFLEHKATYIGIILLIALSTSCFFGLKTSSISTKRNVIDNRISANVEDATFKYSNKLTTAEIERLEKEFDLELQENREVEFEYNEATLRIRPSNTQINKFSVVDGEALKSENYIMVDKFFFKAHRLTFGDNIKVGEKDFIVSGIFSTPNYLSVKKSQSDLMCDGATFGLCIVKNEAFNVIANGEETINYSVIFNQNNSDSFRKELSKNGIVLEFTDKDSNSRIITFDGEVDASIMISEIAPLFILLVSSLIIAVVIGRMLKREYIYIGTLVALGYKKRQIIGHYLSLPIIISIAGSIIGLLGGFLLVKPTADLFSIEYAVPKQVFYYHWEDILIVLVLPVILNAIATFISIIKSFTINTVTLLKNNSGNQKRGLLTRLIPYKKGSFKLRFKLKEIVSNLPRSLVMLVGVIASSIFILSGLLFYGAIDFIYESNFHELFGYEYQYVLKQPLAENKTTGEPYMISGFEYVKNGETFGISLNGVAQNSKYIKLYNDEGNLIPQDKTVIPKSVARRLGLNKGDKISLKSNLNLKNYEFTIDEICTISYGSNIYMPMAKLNSMLEIPEITYVGLYSDEKLDIDPKNVDKILTSEDSKAGIDVAIASFKAMLYLMAFFASVIGVIVIYIITVMLIQENRKNISMLKVIGYHGKEISRLVINSTSLLIWIGYMLALPITKVVIQAFYDILTKTMFISFRVDFKIWQGFAGLVFILCVYYATLFLTKRKVLNINMAESLKARE